jgi:hypothetical protein
MVKDHHKEQYVFIEAIWKDLAQRCPLTIRQETLSISMKLRTGQSITQRESNLTPVQTMTHRTKHHWAMSRIRPFTPPVAMVVLRAHCIPGRWANRVLSKSSQGRQMSSSTLPSAGRQMNLCRLLRDRIPTIMTLPPATSRYPCSRLISPSRVSSLLTDLSVRMGARTRSNLHRSLAQPADLIMASNTTIYYLQTTQTGSVLTTLTAAM